MSATATTSLKQRIEFDDGIVRKFLIASITWGVVGMLVGVIVAYQLNFWKMNGKFLETLTGGLFKGEGLQYITFGRLRPLHTNAAIFAFVGNMMFAGIYYSTQRLCQARMASDLLSKINFWGWQLIIVAAAVTLPAGLTRGKEYAELIWPINLAVVVIWVVFAANFFLTLHRRNEPSLYVALWFYIATIVTVAMLYIVNHLSIPTSLTHSYPVFAGVQDALVQWWYGHNAVAFFLTTPMLGIMYYYLPKAVNRPVYSYRLSIIHFWSLVFLYIWAGPHHLLNTALPKWLQMLGMFFSLMLWAPSWGGMLNGLLTLRGAWDKLRTDPVVKFFVASVTFYGMSTFEGPLLSIRAVNAVSHYSDWGIGHVHSGTLGWNGFLAAAMFYWMAPRLWKTKLWSVDLANLHFWIGLVGILLYVSSMWVSGVTQTLLLNQTDPTGTVTKYAEFAATVDKVNWLMLTRAIGGTLYLVGFLLLAVNIWMTARSGVATNETREVFVDPTSKKDRMRWGEVFKNDPVAYTCWALAFYILWLFLPPFANIAAFLVGSALVVMAAKQFLKGGHSWSHWYDRLLENYLPFSVLVLLSVVIGGLIQIVPTVVVTKAQNLEDRVQKVYSPLELAGRDIYISEGCYNCHSQMIRMLQEDVRRYGDYSRLGESIYDHPFQWGSKRTGPDLARESGKRSDDWHFRHFLDPRSMSTGSRMPAYPWFTEKKTDINALPKKIAVLSQLGVPYEAMTKDVILDKAQKQGLEIAERLVKAGVDFQAPEGTAQPANDQEAIAYLADKQVVAVIAYLQRLGTYDPVDKVKPFQPTSPVTPGIPDGFRKLNTSTASGAAEVSVVP
ncbi:MAG: cytochrome-c oxidase, cbb3-type subunit I [Verrucomicrobiales bacterium]|nr:cytochrome-c oxidase, cbb3-type subunit I [Verrucomicrobiae bacterium]